jgi:hypothetical protein
MFPVTARQNDGMSSVLRRLEAACRSFLGSCRRTLMKGLSTCPARTRSNFTTQRPDIAIKRLALEASRFPLESGRITTVRGAADVANGMALGADGPLVCEQGTLWQPAGITRVDQVTGGVETAVDKCMGLLLNSPNDGGRQA